MAASPYNLAQIPSPTDPSKMTEDTTVLSRVNSITQGDSPLNTAARTEAIKASNRRGLLNSSMAVGAAQDAVIKNAVPIAAQDANQAFTGQQANADRALQEKLQGNQIGSSEKIAAQQIGSAEKMQGAQITSTEGLAAQDRALQEKLQTNQIGADASQQIRDIASREGMQAADQAQQQLLQFRDQQFQSGQSAADRALAESQFARELVYKSKQSALDRTLQQRIASMNISTTERNAAAAMITNMSAQYDSTVASIMQNTAMSAADRATQLTAAKNLRAKNLNFVEQMFGIDLNF